MLAIHLKFPFQHLIMVTRKLPRLFFPLSPVQQRFTGQNNVHCSSTVIGRYRQRSPQRFSLLSLFQTMKILLQNCQRQTLLQHRRHRSGGTPQLALRSRETFRAETPSPALRVDDEGKITSGRTTTFAEAFWCLTGPFALSFLSAAPKVGTSPIWRRRGDARPHHRDVPREVRQGEKIRFWWLAGARFRFRRRRRRRRRKKRWWRREVAASP